jgi:hypothetical protein
VPARRGQGKRDDADEAADQARGEMGHEALERGEPRPRRLRRRLALIAGRSVCLIGPLTAIALARRRGRCLDWRRLDRNFGRGALDRLRRALARGLVLVAERICHHA